MCISVFSLGLFPGIICLPVGRGSVNVRTLLQVLFLIIGLTQKQVDDIDDWGKTNKAPMVAAMQEIVRKRIDIKQAALSQSVSSARIIQMQNEISRLQREVLEYKLSCREQIMKTFNEENWISFFMVLAGEDIGITVPLNYAEN